MSLSLPRRVRVALSAAVILVTVLALPAQAQSFKWWQNERFQRELAMSPEQIARLEDIYRNAGPAMRTQKVALDRLQSDLSKLVADGRADEATADDLIAKVEAAKAELGHTRGVMLYRMRRILTSDQHVKLKVLFAEHEREHPRPKPQQ